MASIQTILNTTGHRPWEMPKGRWRYYQEWNQALFLHWEINPSLLYDLVPKNISIHEINGKTWVSLVAFSMQKIRPRALPPFRPVSSFHEINLRIYVTAQNKPGVYFLSIEAEKYLSARLSKTLSGLPYERSKMSRKINGTHQEYYSLNEEKNFQLDARFSTKGKVSHKTDLDQWLTERYCLYMDHNSQVYRYDIHHLPWELLEVEMHQLHTRYMVGSLSLNRPPDRIHYSPGVQVQAWKKQKIGE